MLAQQLVTEKIRTIGKNKCTKHKIMLMKRMIPETIQLRNDYTDQMDQLGDQLMTNITGSNAIKRQKKVIELNENHEYQLQQSNGIQVFEDYNQDQDLNQRIQQQKHQSNSHRKVIDLSKKQQQVEEYDWMVHTKKKRNKKKQKKLEQQLINNQQLNDDEEQQFLNNRHFNKFIDEILLDEPQIDLNKEFEEDNDQNQILIENEKIFQEMTDNLAEDYENYEIIEEDFNLDEYFKNESCQIKQEQVGEQQLQTNTADQFTGKQIYDQISTLEGYQFNTDIVKNSIASFFINDEEDLDEQQTYLSSEPIDNNSTQNLH
eukprot:403355540